MRGAASTICSAIEAEGFALVRGAIDSSVIARYRAALDRIYAESDAGGDISPKSFAASAGLTIDALFAADVLRQATARLLGGAVEQVLSTFMSVGHDAHSIKGIPFH